MSTSLTKMAFALQDETSWQRTPQTLRLDDYVQMIQNGIKRLYIDTSRASEFNYNMISDLNGSEVIFSQDLPIDEEEYVMVCAKINFFRRVATDVNNIVGYTTNALSVTNADKPYSNIKNTLEDLENERRIIFYKMTNYSFL